MYSAPLYLGRFPPHHSSGGALQLAGGCDPRFPPWSPATLPSINPMLSAFLYEGGLGQINQKIRPTKLVSPRVELTRPLPHESGGAAARGGSRSCAVDAHVGEGRQDEEVPEDVLSAEVPSGRPLGQQSLQNVDHPSGRGTPGGTSSQEETLRPRARQQPCDRWRQEPRRLREIT